jgi:hypothetical protein
MSSSSSSAVSSSSSSSGGGGGGGGGGGATLWKILHPLPVGLAICQASQLCFLVDFISFNFKQSKAASLSL